MVLKKSRLKKQVDILKQYLTYLYQKKLIFLLLTEVNFYQTVH